MKTLVAPPAGFSEPLASLSVVNMLGSHAVAADGSCAPETIPNTPSLIYVEDASGTIFLTGFIDPGMVSNTVNAVSTAIVLLYFGMDGYLLPDGNRSQLLQLLSAHTATASLAAVVSSRLLADARVLVNADGQIAAALRTATAVVMASPNGTVSTVSASSGATRFMPLAAPTPALVQIEPTGAVGGTQVNVDTTVFGFTAVNSDRRYDRIYVYQSGNRRGQGGERGDDTQQSGAAFRRSDRARIDGGPVAVHGTRRHLLERLALLADDDCIDSADLGRRNGSDAVRHRRSWAVGQRRPAGLLFGAAIRRRCRELEERRRLPAVEGVGIDMFGALVLDALGVRQIAANSAAIDTAAQALFAFEDAAWAAVRAQVARGEFGLAAEAGSELAATSDIVSVQFQTILSSIIASGDAAAAAAVSASGFRTTMAGFLRAIGSIASAAIGVLGTIDMDAVIRDLSFSIQGDLWHATLVRPTVTLSPASSTVTPGARVTLSATLPTSVLGPVVYDWSQDGTFSTLSTASATANQFSMITDNVVTLVTIPSDRSTIHVTTGRVRMYVTVALIWAVSNSSRRQVDLTGQSPESGGSGVPHPLGYWPDSLLVARVRPARAIHELTVCPVSSAVACAWCHVVREATGLAQCARLRCAATCEVVSAYMWKVR